MFFLCFLCFVTCSSTGRDNEKYFFLIMNNAHLTHVSQTHSFEFTLILSYICEKKLNKSYEYRNND